MSKRELDRAAVIARVLEKRLTQREAARALGLTDRQVRRLCRRVQQEGMGGLASRARGRPGNRRLPGALRSKVMAIIREHYHDFGPTLAGEKLGELHRVNLSVETLRRWMMADGLWVDRKQRERRPQRPRRRRPCRGELVQIDGSDHHWFEDRGPRCTLLVYIDDATSELMELRFVESESALSYFAATRAYLQRHGKPVALYSDKASTFRVAKSQAVGGAGVTQFGRALTSLNIDIICASTPAAKGRVERANLTLQDRLVKELRLQGISDMATANGWVDGFRRDHNRRFAKPPLSEHDAHRPLLPGDDLEKVFTWQVKRKVTKTLTLRYRRELYVLDDTPLARSARGHRVDVVAQADGAVTIWHQGRLLAATAWAKDHRTHQGDIVENKRLGAALAWAKSQQLAREEARARRPQTTRRDVRMLRGGTRRNAGQSPLARVPG